ncbi:MAG: alpha/beta hydrolase [Rhodobacteraceae bacterium]|nr:alpha/beta hydrolase [Paracoccaceae bacterium]MBL4812044.1 alpha/beta hydrolase [Paracoccaceae bacterium]
MADWTGSTKLIADGKTLEYQCYGPSPDSAITIVLLHEGLGCVALWRDFPAKLAQATGCGVLVYARAGYGQSDLADLPRPLDYMSREAAEILPQVLDQIGVQRCILLGHSDGASIAALYAGSVADYRVRGQVLIAPHFFTEPMGLAEIAKAKLAYENTDLRKRMGKYHRDPDNTFCGWNDSWLHPDFVSWNIADVIDHFRIPTLTIQGRQDPYGTLAQITEIEDRSYAPVETLMLDNCGHAPFLDHPDIVTQRIAAFVSRLVRIEDVVVRTG